MASGSAHTNKKERNQVTPEQKTQLIAAIALRNSIDDVARTEHAIREHKKKRLEIAALLFASDPNYSASEAVCGADFLMRPNEEMITPYCKDEAK